MGSHLDQVSYAFEKIFEEFGRGSTPNMSGWAVGHLTEVAGQLREFIEGARGVAVDSYDSIKHLYDQIEYPLAELTKFVGKEPSEIDLQQRRSCVRRGPTILLLTN